MIGQLDRLGQLGMLRATRVLTDEEFTAQKAVALNAFTQALEEAAARGSDEAQASRRRWLIIGIGLVSLLIVVGIAYAWRAAKPQPLASIPLCNSEELLARVTPLVAQSREAKAAKSTVTRIMDAVERSYDPATKRRVCVAEAILDDGPLHVAYAVAPAADGTQYVVRTIIDPLILPETDTRLLTRGMRIWQVDKDGKKFIATVGIDTAWASYQPSEYECTRTPFGPVWRHDEKAAAADRTTNFCSIDTD